MAVRHEWAMAARFSLRCAFFFHVPRDRRLKSERSVWSQDSADWSIELCDAKRLELHATVPISEVFKGIGLFCADKFCRAQNSPPISMWDRYRNPRTRVINCRVHAFDLRRWVLCKAPNKHTRKHWLRSGEGWRKLAVTTSPPLSPGSRPNQAKEGDRYLKDATPEDMDGARSWVKEYLSSVSHVTGVLL